jgi:predicted MFS family arabinose efflux permease
MVERGGHRNLSRRELAVPTAPRSLWRPLKTPIFRNLLLADLVSDVGTFMQTVGAAWLMLSLGAGTLQVALTQTASTLPFFLLALPAGAIGDIVDRRKLILITEAWMVAVAVVLAVAPIRGVMSPWLLLGLTFALSAGDAIEAPSWRALLPDLVKREDLAAASALSGIEFNVARAIGPALAGVLIATVGIGAAFATNVVSFFGVIVVVARWNRPRRKRTTPPETLTGATMAAVRYVRYAPVVRGLILRSAVTMFFASALLALLPTVARTVGGSATGYGLLLGCFGVGAVLGAVAMQPARRRWSVEAVASGGVAILGVTIAATGAVAHVAVLAGVMLVAGASWIVFISLAGALIQTLAPDWVRARVLAVYLLAFQGGLAAGSAFWGDLAERAGIPAALFWAGLGTIATAALGRVAKLPDSTADVSPWNHWRVPSIVHDLGPELDQGPVLVTVEYLVNREHVAAFTRAIHDYEQVRRRDGASRWGVFKDLENADLYLETFLVSSWAEHLRQHERITRGDQKLEERLRQYTRKEPVVRHLVYVEPNR